MVVSENLLPTILSIFDREIFKLYVFGHIGKFGHLVWLNGNNYFVIWFLFIRSSGFGLMALSHLKCMQRSHE